MGFWRTLLRCLGSLRLAVVLMALLLCALIVGTLWESARGTAAAQASVYHAEWFIGLLGLLATNVLAAMLLRVPFRRDQTGFVITHAGILVTLAGSFVSYHWCERGWLNLVEGSSSNQMITPQQVVSVASGESIKELPVKVDPSTPSGGFPRQLATVFGVELIGQRYLPNSRWEEEYESAEPPAPAAVRLVLSYEGVQVTRWLSTASEHSQRVQVAGVPVSLRLGDTPGETAEVEPAHPGADAASTLGTGEFSASRPSAPADKGRLIAEVGGRSWTVHVAGATGEWVSLDQTGLAVRIVRYLPHAVVGAGGGVENRSDRPVNPMVVYEVIGSEGAERRMAFARFPQFSDMHRRRLRYPQLSVRFELPVEQGQPTGLELVLAPEGAMRFVLRMIGVPDVSGTVLVGEPLAADVLGMDLRVAQILPHARAVATAQPVPYDPKRDGQGASPSFQVLLRSHGVEQWVWLPFGVGRTVEMGDESLELTFGQQYRMLPFRVRLDEFAIDRYPGTQQPAMFRSRVVLTDAQRGVEVRKAIEMNDPLGYRDFDLYQSSYRTDGTQTISVLGVSRDPGWPIVLVGYVMLMLGMAVTLGTRVRRRLRQADDG